MLPSMLNAKETKECMKKYVKREISLSKPTRICKLPHLEVVEEEPK